MLRALPRTAMTCEAARSHIYRAACMHQLQGVWLQQRRVSKHRKHTVCCPSTCSTYKTFISCSCSSAHWAMKRFEALLDKSAMSAVCSLMLLSAPLVLRAGFCFSSADLPVPAITCSGGERCRPLYVAIALPMQCRAFTASTASLSAAAKWPCRFAQRIRFPAQYTVSCRQVSPCI